MADLDSLPYATVRAMRSQVRNEIIEECARVAEKWPRREMGIAVSIMVAIRALKDKP